VVGFSSALSTPGKKTRLFFFFVETVRWSGLSSFVDWAGSGLRGDGCWAAVSEVHHVRLSLSFPFFKFSVFIFWFEFTI
jgi:hypothetical protein